MRASAAWALAAVALGGCADLTRATSLAPAAVNPESPIAPAAIAASAQTYAYPRFTDVPPRPTDLLTPAQLKAKVIDVAHERRDIVNWTAQNPPMTSDTAGYAAQNRAKIQPDMVKPVDAAHEAAMEAYAARERQQGAPPPPLRGQPPPAPPGQ